MKKHVTNLYSLLQDKSRKVALAAMPSVVLIFSLLFFVASCEPENPPIPPNSSCIFENPLTDLLWLKEKIDEYTLHAQEHHSTVGIYQCTYGNGQTGFLEDCGNLAFFYNCEGEGIGASGGVAGATFPEYLNIDFANMKLIWKVENGFINDFCEFDNPLTDLYWLKNIVEEFITYSNTVNQRHFQIYQCTYIEENNEKIGFIVNPICVDCPNGSAMLYKCNGIKLCNNLGDNCDELFHIANKNLIWEINN